MTEIFNQLEAKLALADEQRRKADSKYLQLQPPFTAPITIHPSVLDELRKINHVVRISQRTDNPDYPEFVSLWRVTALSQSA